MEARHPVRYQIPALADAPLYTCLRGLGVVFTFAQLGGKVFRYVGTEYAGQYGELVLENDGLDAGDDGYGDAGGTAVLKERIIPRVVEKHLCDQVLSATADFLFGIKKIGIPVGRLLMLLGITGHAVGERGLMGVESGAVEGYPPVEVIDLALQVSGMEVVVLRVRRLVGRLIVPA